MIGSNANFIGLSFRPFFLARIGTSFRLDLLQAGLGTLMADIACINFIKKNVKVTCLLYKNYLYAYLVFHELVIYLFFSNISRLHECHIIFSIEDV